MTECAANTLEAMETTAKRAKQLQTYNSKIGSVSFVISTFLVVLLPSPIAILAGIWSQNLWLCCVALSGHLVLILASTCCLRCVIAQSQEFLCATQWYQRLQSILNVSVRKDEKAFTPTFTDNEQILNLKGPALYEHAKKQKMESHKRRDAIGNMGKRSILSEDSPSSFTEACSYLQTLKKKDAISDIPDISMFSKSYAPETFGVYGSAFGVPRLYQASDFDPRLTKWKKSQSKEQDALHSSSDPKVAWKQLETWNLEMFMHLYCRNIRRLLSYHIKDVMEAFLQNVADLCEWGIMPDVLLRKTPSQAVLCPPGQQKQLTNVTLTDMVQQFARHPSLFSTKRDVYLFDEHMSFEKYLKVGDPGSVEFASLDRQHYVLERLIDLSKDRNLDRNRWNMGLTWKGKSSSQSYPTDAEIIMNVFCCMLDNLLPADNERDRPFWKSYFLSKAPLVPLSSRYRNCICIVQTVGAPPHFKVMAKGTVYEIVPGGDNCSHAIVVFLHAVKKMKAGFLESINLHRVLDQVFEVSK